MPSTASFSFLDNVSNWLYPASGVSGYVALIDNILTVTTATADITTDEITTAAVQTWRTGSRIRFTTTGTLPAPLALATDYFIIEPGTAAMFPGDTFKLATTLANAIAGTAINLTTIGTGVHTATEQTLTVADPLSVLIAHEFPSHPGYVNRFAISDLSNPLNAALESYKVGTFSYVNNSAVSRTIKHLAFISGGSPYLLDATGNVIFETPTTPVVCAPATPKAFSLRLSVKSN
jgi:hypothetical protein